MRCSRPRGSQIGAAVSHQSSVLAQGREELEQREKELQQVHSLVPSCVQQQWPLDADDLEAHSSSPGAHVTLEIAVQHLPSLAVLTDCHMCRLCKAQTALTL